MTEFEARSRRLIRACHAQKATFPGPNAAPETAHSFIPQIEPGKGGFLPPGCGTCRRIGVNRTSIDRVLSFPQGPGVSGHFDV